MSKKRIEIQPMQLKNFIKICFKESKKKFGTQISWIDAISSFES